VSGWLGRIGAALALAYITLPLVLVVWIGVGARREIALPAGTPSVDPVRELLNDPSWYDAMVRSLLLAGYVAVVGVVVGSIGAYASLRGGPVTRSVVMALMMLPAIVPTVVYALGLVLVSTKVPIMPTHLLVVGHAVVATPLAFLVMRVGVESLRPELVESARLLGASRLLTLTTVVAPHLLPFGLMAAALSASVSLAEPVLAIFLLNDSTATLPQRSFQGLRFSFDPLIFTAATVIILLIGIVVLVCAALLLIRSETGRSAHHRNGDGTT
jgi:putative spermidine/putrescine transport system permease protein